MERWSVVAVQTLAAAVLAAGAVFWLQAGSGKPGAGSAQVPAVPAAPVERVSYRGGARVAMPSVVNIYTARGGARRPSWPAPSDNWADGAQPLLSGLGSGVVWSSDGLVVTNNHVIEGADEVAVVIGGTRSLPARILGTDPESDLAVLRVEAKNLSAIPRGSSRQLEIGDVVLAIGNPFGVGQTVTQGIVSATRRSRLGISTFEDFLQTDAAINPGNSGGALVDTTGALVGINTAIYSRSEGSVGIGFAIPVELVEQVVGQLLSSGRVRRGYLGIETVDLTADVAGQLGVAPGKGVAIVAVQRDGPAGRAGAMPGDIVRGLAGAPVADATDLATRAAGIAPGRTVPLEIQRLGEQVTLEVSVGERPRGSAAPERRR